MNALRRVFPAARPLFIVVHAETPEQSIRNTARALTAGSSGVFLINHVISELELVACFDAVRAAHPPAWLGISFRFRSALDSLDLLPNKVSGLWTGDVGIRPAEADPFAAAREFQRRRTERGWSGLYFGGVAFKYHEAATDPAAAAKAALPYLDVVTTSGDGTGIAAPTEKIAGMKRAIGDQPLAIASGVSADNVGQYLDIADCFLAATSVSDSPSELNAGRIAELRAAINPY